MYMDNLVIYNLTNNYTEYEKTTDDYGYCQYNFGGCGCHAC